jgi:hypothetical protein
MAVGVDIVSQTGGHNLYLRRSFLLCNEPIIHKLIMGNFFIISETLQLLLTKEDVMRIVFTEKNNKC